MFINASCHYYHDNVSVDVIRAWLVGVAIPEDYSRVVD